MQTWCFFLTVSTSLQQIFMRRYPLCAWEYWLASDSNNLVAPYLSNITQENLIRIQERDCVENTYLQYWVPSGNISRKISSQLWRIRSSYSVCVHYFYRNFSNKSSLRKLQDCPCGNQSMLQTANAPMKKSIYIQFEIIFLNTNVKNLMVMGKWHCAEMLFTPTAILFANQQSLGIGENWLWHWSFFRSIM